METDPWPPHGDSLSFRSPRPSAEATRFLRSFTWKGWEPTERATLLFVVEESRILLIRKHRGLGEGKLNGPGGRIEAGEAPLEAALREVDEELCIQAIAPRQVGELRFQFLSGYSLRVFVFRAERFLGEPRSTEEATPIWAPLDRIPFDEMWQDDRHWLPLLIAETPFEGRFVFEDEEMVEGETVIRETVAPSVS